MDMNKNVFVASLLRKLTQRIGSSICAEEFRRLGQWICNKKIHPKERYSAVFNIWKWHLSSLNNYVVPFNYTSQTWELCGMVKLFNRFKCPSINYTPKSLLYIVQKLLMLSHFVNYINKGQWLKIMMTYS